MRLVLLDEHDRVGEIRHGVVPSVMEWSPSAGTRPARGAGAVGARRGMAPAGAGAASPGEAGARAAPVRGEAQRIGCERRGR